MNSVVKDSNSFKLDLENIPSLSFTVPDSFRFSRCKLRTVSTWKELYGLVLSHLCHVHQELPTFLPAAEVGNLKLSKSMRSSFCIKRGIYVETGISSDTIVRRIKACILACNMKIKDLEIIYHIDEERKNAYRISQEKATERANILQLNWDYMGSYAGTKPISYRIKGRNTKNVDTWPELYKDILSYLAKSYPRTIKDGTSLGKGNRIDIYRKDRRSLPLQAPVDIGNGLVTEIPSTSTQIVDQLYNALQQCSLPRDTLAIQFKYKDDPKNEAYTKRISKTYVLENSILIDGQIRRRLRFILVKWFDNGYRVGSNIDQNRFFSFYEEKYREKLPINTEELDQVLQSIAKPLYGKIQIRTLKKVDAFKKTVTKIIREAFNKGATCIYVSILMERYRKELAEIDVHSEEVLSILLSETLDNTFRIHRKRILFGRRKPNVGDEIVGLLKNIKKPVPMEILSSSLWYIPSNVIEREIAGLDSVIQTGAKSFYYAPNLPIKAADRTIIREALLSFFSIRAIMTEIELLEIILQTCPNLLSDIAFLSWNGLRDSLCFLFRDVISTEDSLVVPKNSQ